MSQLGNTDEFTGVRAETSPAIFYAIGNSSLGRFLAALDEKGALCAVLFGDDDAKLVDWLHMAFQNRKIVSGGLGYVGNFLVYMVQLIIDHPARAAKLETATQGGDFAQMVAAALRNTKPGTTITPEEVALAIGAPITSARFVRAHAAADMLAVATPFHRLQEKDGTCPSYRWGEKRRRSLLKREQADLAS